ncbi:hypothetical protein MKX01_036225 [Papaver californicum]|nr:hypothetical protein MKX01_036225 [Papaver californicum]
MLVMNPLQSNVICTRFKLQGINFLITTKTATTVTVRTQLSHGSSENYDVCIMGVHAPDALSMVGNQVTYEEKRILGAFQYASRQHGVRGIFLGTQETESAYSSCCLKSFS